MKKIIKKENNMSSLLFKILFLFFLFCFASCSKNNTHSMNNESIAFQDYFGRISSANIQYKYKNFFYDRSRDEDVVSIIFPNKERVIFKKNKNDKPIEIIRIQNRQSDSSILINEVRKILSDLNKFYIKSIFSDSNSILFHFSFNNVLYKSLPNHNFEGYNKNQKIEGVLVYYYGDTTNRRFVQDRNFFNHYHLESKWYLHIENSFMSDQE